MDENLDVKAGEVQLPEEPSTLKQTTEDVPHAVEQEASDTTTTDTETAESSKGASQRIRELNAAKKAAEAKAQSLEKRLAEITQPIGLPGIDTQYVPQVQPGQEITPEQYQQDVTKTARAEVTIQLAQERAINRINSETKDALSKYPQLDPSSDQFDPELSDTVTEATERYVRSEPYSASVIKYVDKLMKPYTKAVAKEVGQVTENIAKQVSETALRPTSIRQPEKNASEKSLEQLEQELGVVIS